MNSGEGDGEGGVELRIRVEVVLKTRVMEYFKG